MNARQIDMGAAADQLGYERIEWDTENDCYSGFGSSNPYDRSRDDCGGLYIAADDAELSAMLARLDAGTHKYNTPPPISGVETMAELKLQRFIVDVNVCDFNVYDLEANEIDSTWHTAAAAELQAAKLNRIFGS